MLTTVAVPVHSDGELRLALVLIAEPDPDEPGSEASCSVQRIELCVLDDARPPAGRSFPSRAMRLLLSSRALWRACLTGGTRQVEAEHISFSGLEVLLPDRVVLREALPASIHVPFAAMVRLEGEAEGEDYRLADLEAMAASVKAQLTQLTAQLKSGLRVTVASDTPVMGLKVAAGTQIELIANLGHYAAGPADANAPILAVKIRLHAAVQNLAAAVLEVSLQLDEAAESAIALPSLGLRLGQLKLPSLGWSQLEVPRLFESTLGFGVATDWTLEAIGEQTTEAEVEDGTLKSLKISVPRVEVKYRGQPAGSVVDLSIAYGSTGWKVQAQLQPVAFDVEAGKVSLGLLTVAWSDFKVTLSLGANGTISAHAPGIALSISGGGNSTRRVDLVVGVVFDGDRLSLTGLRIVRPSPADLTVLLTKVVKGPVDALVVDIAAGAADLIQAVEEAFLEVVAILAERASAMLQQVVDLAQRLITALSELATEAGLRVDVRFEEGSLKPIAFLISGAKVAPRAKNEWFAAGLKVGLPQSYGLSVLLDLRSGGPDIWLLALPLDLTAAGAAMTVSTDLWLAEGDTVTSSSERKGAPAEEPVIKIEVAPGQANRGLALAGIVAGRPVFLHQTGVLDARAAGLLPMLGSDLEMRPVSPNVFEVKAAFNAGRVLPFLSTANSEIGNALGQHVEVLSTGTSTLYWPRLQVPLTLRIKSAGLEVDFSAVAVMTLPELSVRLEGGDRILVKGKAETKNALGLTWEFEPAPDESLYEIGLTKGEMSVGLAPGAKLTLRYKDVSSDGQGIGLLVTTFRVSRGGLDLDASVLDAPVLLNGLDLPFKFTEGGLSIRGGRITEAYIGGTGRMPPALVGDAPVTIGMRFAERGGRLALVGATAHLDRRDQPLVCESTRFRFSLTALGMDFQTDNGHHFYFLLTGSAQFKPSEGELPDGLLRFLPDVRIDLDAVPLAADVRVLARHISFQVALKPKKRFNLFKAFTFELRGFGFHPQCDAFGGDPAINLSGQISFADTGDVQKPSIDFHGLYIAGPDPEKGSSLPRVRCDRLGVELNTGAVRIRGSVAAVDGSLPTLFIPDALPPSFKVNGFLGNGDLTIDGFASMSASIGFLEVDDGTETKRAFFLYLQKNRLSYKIPTPVVPLFLREVGFGFGYRYTLAGIKAAENSSSAQELIKRLDEIAKRQGELANFGAWAPDVEGNSPKVTLALRAAMSLTTASQEEVYNEKQEVELSNPFFFDITAALRSDFTFLMVIRGWLSVNYHDFHTGGPDLREKPTGYGYLYYNGPRGELLARCRNDPTGYIGKHPQLPSPLVEALRSIEYSSTLYMRPGLFHFELGWPNELRWSMEKGPLKIRCSGGMVYRYGDGALLHGINLQAYARLEVGGDTGGSSIGLSARAVAEFSAEARFITVVDIQNPSKSMLYGLMAFDACLRVAVSAWLRKKIGWVKIELNISFDFQIQISAAVEVAILAGDGLGARAQCRVSVRVFGATLGVSLALGFNEGALAEARARVQRYMALGLTLSSPASGSADGAVGDTRVEAAA
ncbi:MAG: hypothetical protein E6Q99_09030, partial [Elusimicrobia bacterium]